MADHSRRGRLITAAGAVVVRDSAVGPEVLLVHRPKLHSWTLPEGELRPDEYAAGCAVRQADEQAGVRVRLGLPLGKVSRSAGKATTTVSYWRARAAAGPNGPSTGRVAWWPEADAVRLVATAEEGLMIRSGLSLPDTTPVLIVRHGKAMLRSAWSGRDQARPLTSRGRLQSQRLIDLLDAYGVEVLASSTSNRCMKTLQPFAKLHRLEVVGWTTLSEEQAEDNLKAVDKLVRRLAREAVESGNPLAICGHRPVLPTMLAPFGIANRPLRPATALVAHLDRAGQTLAVEHHPPRA